MKDTETTKHESFGMIGFSRVRASGVNLFGSSIKHTDFIMLRIHEAYVDRHLSKNWFHAEKNIIELKMSQSQFAEMITSLNQGDGVPCTLETVMGKRMEECPYISERQRLNDDFESQMKSIGDKIAILEDKINVVLKKKGALTNADKKIVADSSQQLRQEVQSNLPFMRKSYEESVDKTIMEAKAEIEAFTLNKQLQAGLGLVENKTVVPLLEDGSQK